MSRLPSLIVLLLALPVGAPSPAQEEGAPPAGPALADGPVAPIATYALTTRLRTLHGCPRKHVIVDTEGWKRVTEDLAGAPPQPDFSKQVAVLVVVEEDPDSPARLIQLRRKEGVLRVEIERRERSRRGAWPPSLRAFFVVLEPFSGPLQLDLRTLLKDGGGAVTGSRPPARSDRDPARLPRLGPDIALTWRLIDQAPGAAQPVSVELELESVFPDRPDLGRRPVEVNAIHVGRQLVFCYPRIRDGVRYLFTVPRAVLARPLAAEPVKLEVGTKNPLLLREFPPDDDGFGSPRRIVRELRLARKR